MSDALGAVAEPVGSGSRDLAAADAALPPGREGRTALSRRRPALRSGSPLARPGALLRILSRRQRQGTGSQSSDRLDGAGGAAARERLQAAARGRDSAGALDL